MRINDLLKKQRILIYLNTFLALLALVLAIISIRLSRVEVIVQPAIYVNEQKENQNQIQQNEEEHKSFNDEVRAYISEVFADDSRGARWALFVAWNEGVSFNKGYREFDPNAVNGSDIHADGEVGSYGVWQFGKATYNHWCEPTEDWRTDWKAQTRCAKKLWDKGLAFDTWYNNSQAFLEMERTGNWREIR